MTENIENIQEQQPAEQQIDNRPTLDDVVGEKVNFFELPKQEKERLQREWIDSNIPEEDRELFKQEGYAPPVMFGGKDRIGNPVSPKTPEEFKRDIIDKRRKRSYTNELDETKQKLTSVEEQLKQMADILKLQTTSTFESQERDLASRIQKAKDDFDFETYDRLKQQEFEIQKRKSEINVAPKVAQPQQPQFTIEERTAIEEFKYGNPDFVRSLESGVIRNSFDDYVASTAKNRPDLAPKEILRIAKQLTESVFPELAPKQQSNVYMNNQYPPQTSQNLSFTRKSEKPKVVFESLSDWDRKFIVGAAKNYPGKTYQQVTEILASGIGKK